MIFILFVCLSLLFIIYEVCRRNFSGRTIDPRGKALLITGCDSGIGQELAIQLDRKGFNVYAGILQAENKAVLAGRLSSNATVLVLDVTKQSDIDAAYNAIKTKTETLHALINNASVLQTGLIDWQTMDAYRKTMDVIFFGHVALTKKCLPLLVMRRGSRVVNTSSVSGFIGLPTDSPYSAAKYALESFSDCLRREMRVWGLHVSIIEPGAFRTSFLEFYKRSVQITWESASNECRERWGEKYYQEVCQGMEEDIFFRKAENPIKVIQAISHAICSSVPCIRYRPGWQSPYFFFLVSMLPAWIADSLFINTQSKPAGIGCQLTE